MAGLSQNLDQRLDGAKEHANLLLAHLIRGEIVL